MSGFLVSWQAAQRFAAVLGEWRRVAAQKPQPTRPARITVYTSSGRQSPQLPHTTKGRTAMRTVAASVEARGYSRAPVPDGREQHGRVNAGRARGAHLTAQGRSAADPFAGRLHGQCHDGLSRGPACDAAPRAGSRTARVLPNESPRGAQTPVGPDHEEQSHGRIE